jgi:hypothetical protein
MPADTAADATSAVLLISSGCPHCRAVLDGLSTLVKDGRLARLLIINLSVAPEAARDYGVRSVPWCRIGAIELDGLHTAEELRYWAEQAQADTGVATYIAHLLEGGRRQSALVYLQKYPDRFPAILPLLSDPDTAIQVRLGLDAILEDLKFSPQLHSITRELGRLSEHDDPRIRADACHYLSLTGNSEAIPFLRARENDGNADVREIAQESLAALSAPANSPRGGDQD